MARTADPVLIRPLEEADRGEVLDLIARGLRPVGVAYTHEFLNWKHVANPFGVSWGLGAVVGGKLVGLRLFLRWRWKARDREVLAARAVDTVTDPAYRRHRLFTRLTLEGLEVLQKDGVTLVFNTPNRASRPGYLKMGWEVVCRVPLWVRPVLPRRHGDQEALFAQAGTAPASLEGNSPPPPAATDHPWCWSRAPVPHYLAWRYARCPALNYRVFWAQVSSSPAAVVARFRPGPPPAVVVTELLAAPTRDGRRAAGRALGEVLGTASRLGIPLVVAVAQTGTVAARVLARKAFLPVPGLGPVFTVRPLREVTPDPRSWRSWAPSAGDLELF